MGWSREEEKAFENGIAMHWNEECREQSWTKIASMVPTKSILELKHHYHLLVQDVAAIEAGTVPLPNYNNSAPSSSSFISTTTYNKDHFHHKDSKPFSSSNFSSAASHDSASGKGGSKADQERRKGIPWTEEEHRYIYTVSLSLSL